MSDKVCPMNNFYACIKNTCGWYAGISEQCSLVVMAEELYVQALLEKVEEEGE